MVETCSACGKTFATLNQVKGHRAKCNMYQAMLNGIITKEFLYENLITKEHTANHIARVILKHLNIHATAIIERAKKYGIPTKSIKQSANLKSVRDRYKKTCIKKYNAINTLSRNTSGYKKRNTTVKQKYGVENVFQLGAVKTKSKKTLYSRHGVTNPAYLKRDNSGRRSKIHILIESILQTIGITYESEPNNMFLKYNIELQRDYCPRPDIMLPDAKLVVEINGDRWHANPRIYKDSDIIPTWRGNITAREIREADAIRTRHIESFGYSVFDIWEYDIRHNIDMIYDKFDDIKNEIDKNKNN